MISLNTKILVILLIIVKGLSSQLGFELLNIKASVILIEI